VSVAAKRPHKGNISRFIFVRHCEKDVAGQDPPLTLEGQARAKALVQALEDEPIDAIYATPFKRTQMTVQPLAEARHLPVAIVQERNERKFALQLVQTHKNQSVVIASHVNVIPDVVKHLGVREPVSLEEDSYGDIFMVEVDAKGHATMTRSRFGQ
jgi:broad specificity phosphatase PhoE